MPKGREQLALRKNIRMPRKKSYSGRYCELKCMHPLQRSLRRLVSFHRDILFPMNSTIRFDKVRDIEFTFVIVEHILYVTQTQFWVSSGRDECNSFLMKHDPGCGIAIGAIVPELREYTVGENQEHRIGLCLRRGWAKDGECKEMIETVCPAACGLCARIEKDEL